MLGILKWPGDSLRRIEDSTCKLFLKKLTDFYLPSSNMFSRLELESAKVRQHKNLLLTSNFFLAVFFRFPTLGTWPELVKVSWTSSSPLSPSLSPAQLRYLSIAMSVKCK